MTPPAVDGPARTRLDSIAGFYKIAETELGANAASIDMQSIPADYETLIVDCSLRSTAAATFDTVLLAVNNDTTDANYRAQSIQATNTTVAAAQNIGAANVRGQFFATGASSTANDYGTARLVIPNYASAVPTKVVRIEQEGMLTRNSGGLLWRQAALWWLNTAVINRLTFTGSANWLAGSLVSVYGVKTAA